MANVTIKLTVDSNSLIASKENKNMGTYCRLSQTGGEENGCYMNVDFLNSELNVSNVKDADLITWVGIDINPSNNPSNVGLPQISIVEIRKERGDVILGEPTKAKWFFGEKISRTVTRIGKMDYSIFFLIDNKGIGGSDEPYHLDPKMTVNVGEI